MFYRINKVRYFFFCQSSNISVLTNILQALLYINEFSQTLDKLEINIKYVSINLNVKHVCVHV